MANIRRTLAGDGASSCAAPNRAELKTGWGGSYDLKPELPCGAVCSTLLSICDRKKRNIEFRTLLLDASKYVGDIF